MNSYVTQVHANKLKVKCMVPDMQKAPSHLGDYHVYMYLWVSTRDLSFKNATM